jgi:hypothetical protein
MMRARIEEFDVGMYRPKASVGPRPGVPPEVGKPKELVDRRV